MQVTMKGEVLRVRRGVKNDRPWAMVSILGDDDVLNVFADEGVAAVADNLVRVPAVVALDLRPMARGVSVSLSSIKAEAVPPK